ncbi:MAG: hypothetical protein IJK97_11720 [Thermoguttaceae bacterium]|nr:hypothetical protein [Thermoguttaceae bacterium]MBR0192805.1 hypothetical protein [Thermoguttaceae bacterium]
MKPFLALFFALIFPAVLFAQNVNIPDSYGQVWKQYDISAYTSRFPQMSRPESAVADWILMETGFEAWHSEIPAMLNVTKNSVNVYHVPQIQVQVESVIQRFVNVDPNIFQFRVHIFTVTTPYWRQKIGNHLIPVPSFSMGSQAWMVPPENAQPLQEILKSAAGFVNHGMEEKVVPNGQRMEINLVRTRRYTRNFASPSYGKTPKPEEVLLDDGFSFELMPLVTMDGGLVDAQIKFQVNHLDRLLPMNITPAGEVTRNTERIEVPQVGQFRFRERYRWNTENALLVSVGLTPPLTSTGEGSTPSLLGASPRVETLVLVELKRNYK